MKMPLRVVWLKRDLRIAHHGALAEAGRFGDPILLLWIYDDFLKHDVRHSERHLHFQWQSIAEMQVQLAKMGSRILCVAGDALSVFQRLCAQYTVLSVHSHCETGTLNTWERDRRVAAWLQQQGVPWFEVPVYGVQRKGLQKATWHTQWFAHMQQPLPDTAHALSLVLKDGPWSDWPEWNRGAPTRIAEMQPGGRTKALQYLHSFFETRHRGYMRHISKPATARYHCSRLSPYLAWGNLSMEEVWQYSQLALQHGAPRDIRAFQSRLHWQGHFIQKLERDQNLELRNQNAAFDGLRDTLNEPWLQAWKEGQTGYPLVDACMRCVAATGYLNFRMRSMVVSFLTHHLWQPWQAGADWLAAQFLDFEPGIHYAQMQMQAGTTGLHTLRIYDPVKQSLVHDAEGTFIRKWLPELANLPNGLLHKPWELRPLDERFFEFRKGIDYPEPLVQVTQTGRYASEVLWKVLKSPAAQKEAARILKRHVLSEIRRKASESKDNA